MHHTWLHFNRYGWSRAVSPRRARSSRAVADVCWVDMNFSATRPPFGSVVSHTSPYAPRPRIRISRYPANGLAPASSTKLVSVDGDDDDGSGAVRNGSP